MFFHNYGGNLLVFIKCLKVEMKGNSHLKCAQMEAEILYFALRAVVY